MLDMAAADVEILKAQVTQLTLLAFRTEQPTHIQADIGAVGVCVSTRMYMLASDVCAVAQRLQRPCLVACVIWRLQKVRQESKVIAVAKFPGLETLVEDDPKLQAALKAIQTKYPKTSRKTGETRLAAHSSLLCRFLVDRSAIWCTRVFGG